MLMLQEAWYWHFKRKGGPLSSYHDTVFHIPAPRMRDVLSKRLDFAINRVNETFPKSVRITLGGNMVVQPEHISKYLAACRQAFFDDDGITTCYECLSTLQLHKNQVVSVRSEQNLRGLTLVVVLRRGDSRGHARWDCGTAVIVRTQTMLYVQKVLKNDPLRLYCVQHQSHEPNPRGPYHEASPI